MVPMPAGRPGARLAAGVLVGHVAQHGVQGGRARGQVERWAGAPAAAARAQRGACIRSDRGGGCYAPHLHS